VEGDSLSLKWCYDVCNKNNVTIDEMVAEVKPEYTSQICSGCGVKVKKELGERTHDCASCGLQLSRDLNAAKNILRVGPTLKENTPR